MSHAPLPAVASQDAPVGPGLTRQIWSALARGIALFVGFFSLLNLLLQWRTPAFDANRWWIDFQPLPGWIDAPFLLVASGMLLAFGFAPAMSGLRRRATLTVCELLGLVVLWDGAAYYLTVARGTVYSAPSVPFSGWVLVALWLVWRGVARRDYGGNRPRDWGIILAAFLGCCFLFPLAQMACFGTIDYRRPADAAVVFGARVESDGTPTPALEDRVALGVQLYKDKLVPKLILTGTQTGDEPMNEAEVMKRMAVEAGVLPQDIKVDPDGTDIDTSVFTTAATLRSLGDQQADRKRKEPLKMLVVSQFYDLPRIRTDYLRDPVSPHFLVYTVPVPASLARLPRYAGREVAAQWAFYVSTLLRAD